MSGPKPPIPRTFGEITGANGILFACPYCSRATAMSGEEARERWGREGRVEDIARRFKCTNCGARGGAVEIVRGKVFVGEPWGRRVAKHAAPVDKLIVEIGAIKPSGIVS